MITTTLAWINCVVQDSCRTLHELAELKSAAKIPKVRPCHSKIFAKVLSCSTIKALHIL
jgi:hypothetical protein